MTTYNQHKPKRTKGLGFVPPTLQLQHQVRLPFDKCSEADRKASGAEGEVAKSIETESPATESQEADSQSQEADGQYVKGA